MKIIKKINTSAAIALDSSGQEIVVLGKGIGFPKVPYELSDLSVIDRTFYDIDPKYLSLIQSIPNDILIASAEIAEEAEFQLDCTLNANLPFTLADHLAFAISRSSQGINLTTPIAYDVRHFYPVEVSVAEKGLEILKERTRVTLPAGEAINVAMHLINAEAEAGSMEKLVRKFNIVTDIERIVENQLGITFDRDSYIYSRFVTHMQFLVQRLESGKQSEGQNGRLMETVAGEFPQYYECAKEVNQYLKKEYGWECTKDEMLYVMLHISRVEERQSAC